MLVQGIQFIFAKLSNNIVRFSIIVVIIGIQLIISWPVFQGKLFYNKLITSLPDEYIQVLHYFQNQPESSRIASLPVQSYNGWYIQEWGYTGSGFLFYGIRQPILDRAFDVWSGYNETFYNELSTAFYYCPVDATNVQIQMCAQSVKQVFDKYQVSLAMLDESVIVPGQDQRLMRFDLWKKVLVSLGGTPNFQNGFLSVYTVGDNTSGISAPDKSTSLKADASYGRYDSFYKRDVAYVEGTNDMYPFAPITKEDLSAEISYPDPELVQVRGGVESSSKNLSVTFPELSAGDILQGRIRVTLGETKLLVELLPFGELILGDNRFPLWLDRKLEIDLNNSISSAIVMINGKSVVANLGVSVELRGIEMVVGQPVKIDVFQNEGLLVDTGEITKAEVTPCSKTHVCKPVKLGTFEVGKLIEIKTEKEFCLGVEGDDYVCLNTSAKTVTPQSGVYWLDLVLNSAEESFELPKVMVYNRVGGIEFEPKMWQEIKRDFEAVLSLDNANISWQQVVVPTEIDLTKTQATSNNCDVLKRGNAEKLFNGQGITYSSSNYGAYCDSIRIEPMVGEGVLRIDGEGVAGRGIKASLYSGIEERSILEAVLPSKKIFSRSFGYLTGLDNGATLNLETKSFGYIKGDNSLSSLSLYPLPIIWMQKIKVSSLDQEVVAENNIIVDSVQTIGTGFYTIDYKGDGLLVLNQGFDNGWIGLENWKIVDHIKVNGWANGWNIKEGNSITLIYWPQLLEWAGLGILIIGGVWVGLRKLNTHR
jgi:hypothetical protein